MNEIFEWFENQPPMWQWKKRKMKTLLKFTFTFAMYWGLLSLTACNSDSPTAPDTATTTLAVATPQSQNINSLQLANALERAGTISGIKAVVVVRNSLLVGEIYFNGTKKNDLNHVRSVTKSITSILTGIAIQQGLIENSHVRMNDFLKHYNFIDINPAKDVISIEHLLTMTSGLQWDESRGNEFNSWVRSGDQINYVLEKKLEVNPGIQFNYNSGTSHLLSVILSQTSKKSTRKFAEEVLFEPLGISRFAWDRDSRGFYYGGHGLQMRPVDMAKIGILYLQNGRFKNEQIVPEAWVQRSTLPQAAIGGPYGSIQNLGYGYLWWLDTAPNINIYIAWGWGGQIIYCVPELNLVVVTASNWQVSSTIDSQQGLANLDLIVNHILPAVN